MSLRDLIDPATIVKATVSFRSGTPSMVFYCTEASLSGGTIRFDALVDGKLTNVTEIERARISELRLDLQPDLEEP